MEDSGAILYRVSSLKGMLDQVNEEIEANIQIALEIESWIVNCPEIECEFHAAVRTRVDWHHERQKTSENATKIVSGN